MNTFYNCLLVSLIYSYLSFFFHFFLRQRYCNEVYTLYVFRSFIGLIMIIGLVGNVIVVAVITTLRKRGQKASVQLFFLHLAISDLMVCLLCIPLTIFTNFNYPTEFHERDVGLCKISRFMQVLELLLCISQFEISTFPPSSLRKLMQVPDQIELSTSPHSPTPPPPTLFSPHNTGAFFTCMFFYLESYTINSININYFQISKIENNKNS